MAEIVKRKRSCVRDCSGLPAGQAGILFSRSCTPFGGWGNKNPVKRYSGKPARTPKINNRPQTNFTYSGYRQTGLKDLKPTAASYYQNRPTQQITYNCFKSPIEIYEQGKDRISFLYNAGQDRSTMFYGGEQTDQLQRRYRRHYSAVLASVKLFQRHL